MAKKNEFQPDKPYGSWLSKLHLTRQQQKELLKWTLYALLLVVLSVVQDVVLCRLRIFGSSTDLVPCAILLICIIEGSDSGSIFVLVASMLYTFTGTPVGTYPIAALTVLGLAAAIFRQAFLRKGFSAAMLCASVSFFLYEMVVFVVGFSGGLTTFGRFLGFVATAVMTFISAPVLYPVLALFVVKELFQLFAVIVCCRRGKALPGALNVGKVCTTVLFVTLIGLVLFPHADPMLVNMTVLADGLLLFLSFASYFLAYCGKKTRLQDLE